MDYQIATAWFLVNFWETSRNLAGIRQMAPTVDDNIACFTAVTSTRMTDFI